MQRQDEYLLADVYSGRITLVILSGLALTLLAGWVASRLTSRIDRGIASVVRSAELIGGGQQDNAVTLERCS